MVSNISTIQVEISLIFLLKKCIKLIENTYNMVFNKCNNQINTMTVSPRYIEYAVNDKHITLVSRYGYVDYDDCEDDVCESCHTNTPLYSCNKCGNGICDDEECAMTFPHYSNTTYFVCKSCVDTISLKLILEIDLGKLELLKEKIRTGTTSNSVCSSRATSRSSCCSNTIRSLSDISNTDSDEYMRRNSTTSSSSDEFM
jgi:hypothetical protein